MATAVLIERSPAGLAGEIAEAWGAKAGGKTDVAAGASGITAGWLVTLPVTGASRGHVSVCVDAKAAATLAQTALKLDAEPGADAVSPFIAELAGQAAAAFLSKAGVTGAALGQASVADAAPPDGAAYFDLSLGGKPAGKIAIVVELAVAAQQPSSARRLETVLDVDLPLVVRFGRATMPLRALAVLGPGSVIDMGRSPDEPVELLVGDRLIARGEVVIVGGNYGVRITDLTQQAGTELEARTS